MDTSRLFSLEGRTALITGGSRGIGRMIAEGYLAQGARVYITARKKAEAYLEFLGKHDVLTKLKNRSFYIDEINRLERKGPFPVTAIAVDVNGLKGVNDQLGHAAGDALLRRAGEVLAKAVEKPFQAARIGGITPWRPFMIVCRIASGVPPCSQSLSVRFGNPLLPRASEPWHCAQ